MFALVIQNGRDESNALLLLVDRHYQHFRWLAGWRVDRKIAAVDPCRVTIDLRLLLATGTDAGHTLYV
jgi:hypothetical protein